MSTQSKHEIMRVYVSVVLVFGTPKDSPLKFIAYSYSVQIMHAKLHWNPLSVANKIHEEQFIINNRNYAQL